MQKNGIFTESGGTYGWHLSAVSVSKTRKYYKGTGFKTRIECAYDYMKSVMKYDPKAAELLKGKETEDQFKILGVNL